MPESTKPHTHKLSLVAESPGRRPRLTPRNGPTMTVVVSPRPERCERRASSPVAPRPRPLAASRGKASVSEIAFQVVGRRRPLESSADARSGCFARIVTGRRPRIRSRLPVGGPGR